MEISPVVHIVKKSYDFAGREGGENGGTVFFLVREQERTKEKAKANAILALGREGVILSPQGEHHLPSGKLHCETTSLAEGEHHRHSGERRSFLFENKKEPATA